MIIIEKVSEMQQWAEKARKQGYKIALVPTMGFIHKGHRSLMKIGKKHADLLVVSIFVNPTQFGPGEDFEDYPRDFERDRKICEEEEADVVFHPPVDEMYPEGFQTYVEVEEVTKDLCGASRPHFFRGVTTVCTKLFNAVKPHVAIFGEKDYQQLVAVRRMAHDLNFDIEIVSAPTIREEDGLAVSSRNVYLNEVERKAAAVLNRSLNYAKKLVGKGIKDPQQIVEKVREQITTEPLIRIDYVKIKDAEDLRDISTINGPALLAVAAWVGKARLIDNTILTPSQERKQEEARKSHR